MWKRRMRPGRAAAGLESSIRSISSSVASDSLKPSPPKNLMPLSSDGLCDADSTTASAKPWRRTSSGAPGVGRMPPSIASPPAAEMPAATAASSISPDSRVSRMTSTRGTAASTRRVAARASASDSSAVRNSPATPRTPSVPKSLRAKPLALRELRPLAGLLEAGLLALLDASVAREEAAALELGAQVRVGVDERLRDRVAQGAGLGRHAAAVHRGDDVDLLLQPDGLERGADRALQCRPREEDVERAAVDLVCAGARLEDHARDGGLALAGRGVAGAGGEVDRRVGDRLGQIVLGGLGLGVPVEVLVLAEGLLALAHDVDLEVHAGDLRLDARGLVDELLVGVLLRRCPGRGSLGDRLLRRGLLGDGLLGGRVGLLGGRLGLRRGRRLGRGLDSLGLRLVRRLRDVRVALVVAHRVVISSFWGFCASCGCSGPA